MKEPEVSEIEARAGAAIGELRTLIAASHPGAAFEVGPGYDPDGTYLKVFVESDDLDSVRNTYIDRLLEFQVDDALPVYVVPLRPRARSARAAAAA